MRSLSKVIFINSANTPYAELRLDGNVHFIGTQGVGKSTLLRAILFFYNGDKLHLGIPKEKKGFDDFYLPHSNSYIIYEVAHEHGPFCVVVLRNQGRACFRFIDAAYRREWFVDGMTGDVTSEYTVIRQRLEGRHLSRLIDKYDEYRNIIYGNRLSTDKEFHKFSLMESTKYQNIPRSLQNVFLNSRVDADFIKEIIIRSMNEDEAGIDLGYYRRQVARFGQEYNDIAIWFKVGAKGKIEVRTQADDAINKYRQLLYLKEQITDTWAQLLYAEKLAAERIPYLEQSAQNSEAEISRLERLLSEEKGKFDKEKEALSKELGAVEANLKEIKRKRKRYDEIGIAKICSRVDAEPQIREHLESLIKTKETLTREYSELATKYDSLEETLRSEERNFETSVKNSAAAIREEHTHSIEKAAAIRDRKRVEAEAQRESAAASLEEKYEAYRQNERQLDRDYVQLKYFRPLGDKIDAERLTLGGILDEQKGIDAQIRNYALQIDNLTGEYEAACLKVTHERDDALIALDRDAQGLREKIASIGKMLSDASGSLYEWLDGNVKGWENNIGKVVDEQRVLYRKGLRPTLVDARDATSSLFGVSIDLGSMESDIRTPESLRREKETCEIALDDIAALKAERLRDFENGVSALSEEMSPKMKELRRLRGIAETKAQAFPGRVKALEMTICGLEDQQKHLLEARKEELDRTKMDLMAQKKALDDERSALLSAGKKAREGIDKGYEAARTRLEKERDVRLGELNLSLEKKKAELADSLGKLKTRRDAEMKGAGVDTQALDECENQLKQTREELHFIENNRQLSLEYRIDTKNLFDREEEFKENRQGLENRKSLLESRFDLRGKKLQEQKAFQQKRLEATRLEKKECEEGIEKCEEFRRSESLFLPFLANVRERETFSTPLQLYESLRCDIFARSELSTSFKMAVNTFNGNFSPGNTFKFKTNLTLDEDYMDYAASLEEFVQQNKIEDYRGRTSNRYLEILTRVSREMGDLSRGGSEVERIIRDINYDFKEKNFVGAIKSIEMRRCDSADKMVQLLLKIKEFSDENQFHLSGVNLFSDTDEQAGINRQAVKLLQSFMGCLDEFSARDQLTLSDTFQLQFRVLENDNDTGWVEKIANVGSDGTDILVKAMVNIMLINVFKEKVSRKFGEFRIHCVMDEIGKLHPSNVKGILDFANSRNILLINSSPTTYNVSDYRYTYLLSKDAASKTKVVPLITRKEAEMGL